MFFSFPSFLFKFTLSIIMSTTTAPKMSSSCSSLESRWSHINEWNLTRAAISAQPYKWSFAYAFKQWAANLIDVSLALDCRNRAAIDQILPKLVGQLADFGQQLLRTLDVDNPHTDELANQMLAILHNGTNLLRTFTIASHAGQSEIAGAALDQVRKESARQLATFLVKNAQRRILADASAEDNVNMLTSAFGEIVTLFADFLANMKRASDETSEVQMWNQAGYLCTWSSNFGIVVDAMYPLRPVQK